MVSVCAQLEPCVQLPSERERTCPVLGVMGLGLRHLSNGESLDKATVKLADVAVEVPRLREAPLAPLTGVRLFTCVNHCVPAQVMGVLEALAALATGVWLLARVCALVALQGVHAGEGLAALRAGGHGAVGGELGAHPVLLAEVRAEMQLEHMGAGEDFAAEGAHAHLLPRGQEHPAGRGDVRGGQVVLLLLLTVPHCLL